MARGVQLKALLRSHLEGDEERFRSVALQLAAHEARLGHGKLAEELRALIDDAKRRFQATDPVPIGRPRGELSGLLEVSYPKSRLVDMILDERLRHQIQRVIREQRNASRILDHGLSPRRKLLLIGPPGTGKTLTASVLASELGMPLLQVRFDGLITKYMGETAAKLRQVFDTTGQNRGIYLFDEFDAIGSRRSLDNDVGEIRRVLNSFLQMIEQDHSHSLIIAATNHPGLLDGALYRRFDDVLHYHLPDAEQIAQLLDNRLGKNAGHGVAWRSLGEVALGLSYAEVRRAASEVLKDAIIEQRDQVRECEIQEMLEERLRMSKQGTASAALEKTE